MRRSRSGRGRPDALAERLERPAPPVGAVIADGFHRPATLDECLGLLARDPEAELVAGATDLAAWNPICAGGASSV